MLFLVLFFFSRSIFCILSYHAHTTLPHLSYQLPTLLLEAPMFKVDQQGAQKTGKGRQELNTDILLSASTLIALSPSLLLSSKTLNDYCSMSEDSFNSQSCNFILTTKLQDVVTEDQVVGQALPTTSFRVTLRKSA